jgi:hypothetical protein
MVRFCVGCFRPVGSLANPGDHHLLGGERSPFLGRHPELGIAPPIARTRRLAFGSEGTIAF